MADQLSSSPKIVEPKSADKIETDIPEEHRLLPAERCGYCGKTKRPERGINTPEHADLCKCPSACDSSDPNIRLGAVPSSAFRRSPSPRPSLVPPVASDTVTTTVISSESGIPSKYEIVSIREKHGDFRKAIPHMPVALAVFLCLLNVLVPGIGTLISTFTVFCGCSTEHPSRRKSVVYNLLAALLQFIMAPLVVGWIWSVLWGITFVNISASKVVDGTTSNTV